VPDISYYLPFINECTPENGREMRQLCETKSTVPSCPMFFILVQNFSESRVTTDNTSSTISISVPDAPQQKKQAVLSATRIPFHRRIDKFPTPGKFTNVV